LPSYPAKVNRRPATAHLLWSQRHFAVIVMVPVQAWLGNTLHQPPVRRISVRPPSLSAGPLVVPAAPAVPELALSVSAVPVVGRLTVTEPSRVAPVYVPDVTVQAPVLSWEPSYPDRAPGARRLLSPPAFSIDARYLAPAAVVVPEFITPVYPGRVPGRPRIDTWRHVTPIHIPDVTDPVPRLAWDPSYPDRALRVRLPDLSQSVRPLYVPDVTVVAPALSWLPRYPDRALGRRPPHFPAFAFDARYIAPGVIPAPDLSWQPVYPDWSASRRLTGRHMPALSGPLHVPDVTQPVIALAWDPQYPDRVFSRRPNVAQGFVVVDPRWLAPGVAEIPELVPAVYPAITRRRGVWPSSALLFVPELAPHAVGLTWLVPSARVHRPRFASRPSVSTSPILVPDVTQPVTALAWHPVYPDRVWRFTLPRAQQLVSVTPIYLPDVTVQAPPLAVAVYVDSVYRPKVQPLGFIVGSRDITGLVGGRVIHFVAEAGGTIYFVADAGGTIRFVASSRAVIDFDAEG